MLKHAEHFTELVVYQKAYQLQQEVFVITKSFPKEENYSLTDQIRRSSRSIGANIAEAWKKRAFVAHFRSKLSDSDGELSETEHWLYTSKDCGYILEEEMNALLFRYEEVGKIIGSMIHDAEKWCPGCHKYGA